MGEGMSKADDLSRVEASPTRRAARVIFWILVAGGAVGVWFSRDALRSDVFAKAVMQNDAPTAEAMAQVIDGSKDRLTAIEEFWRTKNIVPREAALRQLAELMPESKPLPEGVEGWVQAAALDPDMDTREAALGILREHNDPALASICAAELQDSDPMARLLGLDGLKRVSAASGAPLVIPPLDDSDPRVVSLSLKLLENWTGQSFGVRLSDTVPTENKESGLLEFDAESYAKTKAGAERAKAWWEQHRGEFAAVHPSIPANALAAMDTIPAGDFSLSTLDGRRVRLSDFRGKVVLLNFWTTWCTACVGEMPELIELQKRHHDQLVILGISLDSVPDEDDVTHSAERPLDEIRKKVARMVAARQINYPVLLDEKGSVGARFNGGELPTTVIVDAAGNVRRRFVGARSLAVFEAMIADASRTPMLAKSESTQ
jgi:thiol-disulfide isomerase/thioredoxin